MSEGFQEWGCVLCGARGSGALTEMAAHAATCPKRIQAMYARKLRALADIVMDINALPTPATIIDLLRPALDMVERETKS